MWICVSLIQQSASCVGEEEGVVCVSVILLCLCGTVFVILLCVCMYVFARVCVFSVIYDSEHLCTWMVINVKAHMPFVFSIILRRMAGCTSTHSTPRVGRVWHHQPSLPYWGDAGGQGLDQERHLAWSLTLQRQGWGRGTTSLEWQTGIRMKIVSSQALPTFNHYGKI